jgi:hypothetical protein
MVEYDEDDRDMYKIFNRRGSKRLSDMLADARKSPDTKPEWIGKDEWISLQAYWGSEKFKKLSDTNKKNQSSEASAKHTCGSASMATTFLKLVCTRFFLYDWVIF